MLTIRRWYLFLVCAISLNAVAWVVIALLRNLLGEVLLGRQSSLEFVALQIAILLVGTPVYLVHWLWAQGAARKNQDERASTLRRAYLFGTLAGFLAPIFANAFNSLAELLSLLPRFGVFESEYFNLTEALLFNSLAILVLAVVFFYHQRILRVDLRQEPEREVAPGLRRFFVYGFSAAGMLMASLGSIHLLRWIMIALLFQDSHLRVLPADVALLLLGAPLWLFFWQRGPRLWDGDEACELDSSLRRFYLYTTVFVSALTVVLQGTVILAGLFSRLLDLPSRDTIASPLPVLIVMLGLWAYHATILRKEAALVAEAPRQAGIRRLYAYLIAAIGLAAFLVGLGGDISVMIRSFSPLSRPALDEQLAWFSAALLAGFPVWSLPWRRLEGQARLAAIAGVAERASLVRKLYLYFYLFLATMTVLSGLVYTLYRVLSVVLGAARAGNLLVDIGQALAFSLVAVGVWIYHGSALRRDGSFKQREQNERLSQWRVVVVDAGDGSYGKWVLQGLRRDIPALNLDPVGLTPGAVAAMGAGVEAVTERIAQANLVVGPAFISVPCGGDGAVSPQVAEAVAMSHNRKLLAPIAGDGWEWIGVDRWDQEGWVRQTVQAVKQIVQDEPLKPHRPLGAGAVIGMVAIGLWLLPVLVGLVISILDGFWY
jgi:hypothetical protein